MDNFLIEEFSFYKVFLYGRQAEGQQTDFGINISLPSGKAIMKFVTGHMPDNYAEKNGDKYVFHIFLRSDKYVSWIDILRNEKPLFFSYNFDTTVCYITTSDEPVGEGENEAD